MPPTVPALRIGSHAIWPPLVLAPMSGVTNRTMRALYKPFGLGLTVTEFVSSNALKYTNKRTMEMIDQHGLEKPVSTQLWGDDPATMAAAAKVVRECGADDVGARREKLAELDVARAEPRERGRQARLDGAARRPLDQPHDANERTRRRRHDRGIDRAEYAFAGENKAGATKAEKIRGSGDHKRQPECNATTPPVMM